MQVGDRFLGHDREYRVVSLEDIEDDEEITVSWSIFEYAPLVCWKRFLQKKIADNIGVIFSTIHPSRYYAYSRECTEEIIKLMYAEYEFIPAQYYECFKCKTKFTDELHYLCSGCRLP